MKVKKMIMYGLVSFVVFLPLLNLEGWALSRSYTIIKAPAEGCVASKRVCFRLGDQYCCEYYCCDSNDITKANCDFIFDTPVCVGGGTDTPISILK